MKRFNRTSLIGLALASMFTPFVRSHALFAEGDTQTGGGSDAPAPAPKAAPTGSKPKAKKAKPAKKAAPKPKAKKAKKSKSNGHDEEGMAVLRDYAADYERPKGKDGKPLKTAAGNPVIDSGDEVAVALRGKDLDTVYSVVAKRIGVTEKDLRAKYGKLNLGQQRMNLGNRLRGHLNAKAAKAKAKK